MQGLTHGSLFSGIGGFELGAKLTDIPTLWNCEISEFNRKVLKQNFPESHQYEDVTKLKKPSPVTIISGGFPCQDISNAGSTQSIGITGSRSRLWWEMFRIIDETRPLYVVIENSPELLKKGFENVLYPLSEIGYNAEWQCLSGLSFGVQQRRERLYCIAYTNSFGQQGSRSQKVFREWFSSEQYKRISPGWLQRSDIPQPRGYRSTNDLPNLMDRIKAGGNAVMPVVAKYLFDCIKTHYLEAQNGKEKNNI